MPSACRWLMVLLVSLLAGCATHSTATRAPVDLPPDAQNCLSHSECTLKTSRTLLFVFDYAAAGGALVEKDGRVLVTPEDAPKNRWPALRIQLADSEGGRFEFHSECRQKSCRISDARLLACYRTYLDGGKCRLR